METLPSDHSDNRKFWPPKYTTVVWRLVPQNPWTVFSESTLTSLDFDMMDSFMSSALILRTTTALLSLRKSGTVESETDPSSNVNSSESAIIQLDIVNSANRKIGRKMNTRNSWIEQWLDLEAIHEFVVLSAAVEQFSARKEYRWVSSHELPRELMWELRVMLVCLILSSLSSIVELQ